MKNFKQWLAESEGYGHLSDEEHRAMFAHHHDFVAKVANNTRKDGVSIFNHPNGPRYHDGDNHDMERVLRHHYGEVRRIKIGGDDDKSKSGKNAAMWECKSPKHKDKPSNFEGKMSDEEKNKAKRSSVTRNFDGGEKAKTFRKPQPVQHVETMIRDGKLPKNHTGHDHATGRLAQAANHLNGLLGRKAWTASDLTHVEGVHDREAGLAPAAHHVTTASNALNVIPTAQKGNAQESE